LHKDKQTKFEHCLYYIIVISIVVLTAVVFAIIFKSDKLTDLHLIVIGTILAMIPTLALIFRSARKTPINIKISFSYFPCRKGIIRKNDGKISICHRCVPFHFSLWPIIAFIIPFSTVNGSYIWEPFYNFLITNLGEFWYIVLTSMLCLSIPIEAGTTIKLQKQSKNISRWITSLLTTAGILLGLMYFVEIIPELKI